MGHFNTEDTTADQQADDHGHSVAGWTGVTGVIIGAALIGVGVGFGYTWLWMIGWAVVALAALAGFALSRAGFGHRPLPKPMEHSDWVSQNRSQQSGGQGATAARQR